MCITDLKGAKGLNPGVRMNVVLNRTVVVNSD